MAIIKTIPSTRLINGEILETSEISIVSEREYRTNGEECIIVRNVQESTIILDSKTTDHVVVKSMSKITIKPDVGRIDEDYDEIIADRYACIEFRFCTGNWYVLSSDGLKSS
tara:strand:+ start:37 stop:372 length:336 start_codon:yes stop_codon:yes gene_type:complete